MGQECLCVCVLGEGRKSTQKLVWQTKIVNTAMFTPQKPQHLKGQTRRASALTSLHGSFTCTWWVSQYRCHTTTRRSPVQIQDKTPLCVELPCSTQVFLVHEHACLHWLETLLSLAFRYELNCLLIHISYHIHKQALFYLWSRFTKCIVILIDMLSYSTQSIQTIIK